MKWIWYMILMWDLLECFKMCLKLIHVKFQLLFWIFSPSLTLGFDLVVCCLCLSFDFRFKHSNVMVDDAPSFEHWCLPLITNICVFCRLMLTHLSLPYGLHILYIGIVCCLLTVVCLSEYCTDLFSCLHRYLSCFKFIWTLLCLWLAYHLGITLILHVVWKTCCYWQAPVWSPP